ncbi:MAG: hypothetical protein ACRDHW_18875 [Ktedonobacteraceae bacterium]
MTKAGLNQWMLRLRLFLQAGETRLRAYCPGEGVHTSTSVIPTTLAQMVRNALARLVETTGTGATGYHLAAR